MTTPVIPCADVVRELWDYLDSELEPSRWEAIRAHLGTCDGCRSHVEFCRAFLARVGTHAIPADEVGRTAERIRALLAEEAER